MPMYYSDQKVKKVYFGDIQVKKIYMDDTLVWNGAYSVSYISGSSTNTYEIDEDDTAVRTISSAFVNTHSNNLTHGVPWTCGHSGVVSGTYYAEHVCSCNGGISTNVLHTSYTCPTHSGYLGEDWSYYCSAGTYHSNNSRYNCNASGTTTVVDCYANTNHGSATMKMTGIKTLSLIVNGITPTSYTWYKDSTVISTKATASINGSASYMCRITWVDPNKTSVSNTTEITTKITISD